MVLPTSLLFEMRLGPLEAVSLGETVVPERRLATIGGGHFEGPELSGTVCAGGTDWITVRADGSRKLDVNLLLETVEGDLFAMGYRGYRTVDEGAGSFVYRTVHWFEAAGRLEWLNTLLAVGVGTRGEDGLEYRVYRFD